MAFLCGKNPWSDSDGDEGEMDEQPTLPSRIRDLIPTDTEPMELYQVDEIIKQARARYLDPERNVSNRDFCPVCWRYARARGVEDNTFYLYPRPCPWHAQAIIEAEPATRRWLIEKYRDALKYYLFPPGLRQAVDRRFGADDDRSADDGTK